MAGFRVVVGAVLALGALTMVPASPHAQPELAAWTDDFWDPVIRGRDEWRPDRMGPQQRHRMERHWAWMTDSVPGPYRGARNPLPGDPATIAAGAAIYAEQCVGCHGEDGFGNGDAGLALDPSPALLAFMVRMPHAVDEYLLWSVAEGGLPFGSEMPAYKDRLSRDEIWQVISYMRAGFPDGSAQ